MIISLCTHECDASQRISAEYIGIFSESHSPEYKTFVGLCSLRVTGKNTIASGIYDVSAHCKCECIFNSIQNFINVLQNVLFLMNNRPDPIPNASYFSSRITHECETSHSQRIHSKWIYECNRLNWVCVSWIHVAFASYLVQCKPTATLLTHKIRKTLKQIKFRFTSAKSLTD